MFLDRNGTVDFASCAAGSLSSLAPSANCGSMADMKVLLYILTGTCALFFAFWEEKLKRDLTNSVPQRLGTISEIGFLDDIKKGFDRERFLATIPAEVKRKLRIVVVLKFVAAVVLILEVILLQR